MMHCIAIDDEPMALEVIKAYCEDIPFLKLTNTFTQPSLAKKYLKKFPVDLIFLDIEMPDINGIDFYKSIHQDAMVVFTTAHKDYAVEGFNLNAVDYVLKPLEFDRFVLACKKANDFFEYNKTSTIKTHNYLYVRAEYALVKIPFEDILFFETMDDYIRIHTENNEPVLTLMSMKKMMQKLPASEFIRVHRSFIVPFSKVDSVRAKTITIKNNEIPIGTCFEKKFFQQFKKE